MIKKRGVLKNIGRILEINRVLKKYKLRRFVFKGKIKDPEKLAENLRKAFEELGPVFIKLGQFLSINYLIIPEVYRKEFEKLQDRVPSFPFSKAKSIIEKEFGQEIDELFDKIEEVPIASASLAQVHRAKLVTGEIVVVKVQRPDVEEQVEKDLSALSFLGNRIKGKLKKNGIDFEVILKELEEFLKAELDYSQETIHADLFRRQELSKYEKIPKIYLHTKKVIIEEYINGIKISDTASIHKAGIDKEKVIDNLVKSTMYHMFNDGLFHGDLHPANILVLKDGKIGFIDFGVAGKMPENIRNMYLAQYNALFENNPEKFIQAHLDANGLKLKDIRKYKKLRLEMTSLLDRFSEKKSERAFDYLFEAYSLLIKYKVPQKNEFLISTRSTLAVNNLLKRYGFSDKKFEPLLKKMILVQTLPIAQKLGPSILEIDESSNNDLGKTLGDMFKGNGLGFDKMNPMHPLMMINDFSKQFIERVDRVENAVEGKLKNVERKVVGFTKIFGWGIMATLIGLGVAFYDKINYIIGGREYVIQGVLGLIFLLLLVDIFRMRIRTKEK